MCVCARMRMHVDWESQRRELSQSWSFRPLWATWSGSGNRTRALCRHAHPRSQLSSSPGILLLMVICIRFFVTLLLLMNYINFDIYSLCICIKFVFLTLENYILTFIFKSVLRHRYTCHYPNSMIRLPCSFWMETPQWHNKENYSMRVRFKILPGNCTSLQECLGGRWSV